MRATLRRVSLVLFVASAFAFGACISFCTLCIRARAHVDGPLRPAGITALITIATSIMGLALQRRSKAPIIEWIAPPPRRWP